MSLNFSRRAFFRFLATALLTVCCLGMLTGCFQDPNNPVKEGTGSLTVAKVTSTMTSISTSSGVTAKFTIENGADNAISVRPENFAVFVTSNGTTTEYNSVNSSLTLTGATNLLAKNSTVNVTVTVSGVSLSSGDTVKVTYWPRMNYTEISASWKTTIK